MPPAKIRLFNDNQSQKNTPQKKPLTTKTTRLRAVAKQWGELSHFLRKISLLGESDEGDGDLDGRRRRFLVDPEIRVFTFAPLEDILHPGS